MKRGGHLASAAARPRYGAAARVCKALAALAALVFTPPGGSPALGAPHTPVVLVFGDSLAAGHGLPESEGFPARLEARLRQQHIAVRIIDAGVSGDTTAGGVARLDWALADKPDCVLLELGANDALRGIDPAIVRDNLDKMIRKIKASGARLLLIGMRAPPNWGREYQNAFDRVYPDLARADHVPLFAFFLEGVAMKPELNQPDGLHPNARGVEVLVDHLAPVVARLLRGAA